MVCNDFDNDSENDLPFNNFSREESSQEKETNTENDVLSVQATFHEWPVKYNNPNHAESFMVFTGYFEADC